MSEKYNGWANRETWAAYLWLTNDEGLYREAIETLGPFDREAIPSAALLIENLVYGLFDYETLTPETYSMREDIGSLWRVNWREIVTHLLNEAKQFDERFPNGLRDGADLLPPRQKKG